MESRSRERLIGSSARPMDRESCRSGRQMSSAHGVTLRSDPSRASGSGGRLIAVPTISRFYGIVIRMYFSDHAPPHFHAVYAGEEAVIMIATGEILRGRLPDR